MADPSPLRPRPNSPTGGSDDWPARAASAVVRQVGTVRDKTTGPVLSGSRFVVYGLAMALIGLVIGVLALILAVRLLVTATGYVPGVEPGETWLAYLILGGIFLLAGVLLWRRKDQGGRRA